jgi:hypothetical protein
MDPILIPLGSGDFFSGPEFIVISRVVAYIIALYFCWFVFVVAVFRFRAKLKKYIKGRYIVATSLACFLLAFPLANYWLNIDHKLHYQAVTKQAKEIEHDWQVCSTDLQKSANKLDISWHAVRNIEAEYVASKQKSEVNENHLTELAYKYTKAISDLEEAKQEFRSLQYQVHVAYVSFSDIASLVYRYGKRADELQYKQNSDKYDAFSLKARGLSEGSIDFYEQYFPRDGEDSSLEKLTETIIDLSKEIESLKSQLETLSQAGGQEGDQQSNQESDDETKKASLEKNLLDKTNVLVQLTQSFLHYRMENPIKEGEK